MADEMWTYPAPAWEAGDRVAIDDDGHPWHDEHGTVLGPDDRDAGTWTVRLDSGEEVEAYTHELTGLLRDGMRLREGGKQ